VSSWQSRGAASAFSSNGDINAIAIGALTGAGFGAAGGVGGADSFARYAAHASVGCVSAVAGGGNCGAGAASAVFGKYTTNALGGFGGPGVGGVIARGVATVVAGGVGSVIAGGKFENGATTAAFGYLFNQVAHGKQDVTGRPLSDAERQQYSPYFPEDVLNTAVVYEGKVPGWLRSDMDGITLGKEIYFRAGVYVPDTAPGVEILGHELVHVGQYQNGMTVFGYIWESRNGYQSNKYEVDAYAKGAKIRADFCTANPGKQGC
jgi:hypothetical protein